MGARQPWPAFSISSVYVSTFARPFDDESSPLYRHSSLGLVLLFLPSLLCLVVRHRHRSLSPSRPHRAFSSNQERGRGSYSWPSHLDSELTRRVTTYVTAVFSKYANCRKWKSSPAKPALGAKILYSTRVSVRINIVSQWY